MIPFRRINVRHAKFSGLGTADELGSLHTNDLDPIALYGGGDVRRSLGILENAYYASDEAITDEVIAELESQKALLASLDQRIAYSTIYLTLSESEEEVTGQNDGFFTRLGREFMNSLDFVGNFFTALAILLVGNLPLLLVIGAVVVLIVWICRKRKKARAKSQNEQQ